MTTYKIGKWSLDWEYIGEGLSEGYNENDPNDRRLLRATLKFDGEPVDNGSYCTLASANTPESKLEEFSRALFRDLKLDAEDSDGSNFRKKIMERWTHTTEA